MKIYSVGDILERLKKILSIESDQELAAALGVSKAAISNWKRRKTIEYERVFSVCEHVSLDWLLTGEGDEDINRKSRQALDLFSEVETRPRIPLDAAAGALSIVSDTVTESDCERLPLITYFPNYDFTIMVKGDSMEPEFHSGDEVACRFVDRPSFIQWGRPHILDTNQGVVVKRIYNHRDAILCKSDNESYEDFEIPKEDIYHIALVG